MLSRSISTWYSISHRSLGVSRHNASTDAKLRQLFYETDKKHQPLLMPDLSFLTAYIISHQPLVMLVVYTWQLVPLRCHQVTSCFFYPIFHDTLYHVKPWTPIWHCWSLLDILGHSWTFQDKIAGNKLYPIKTSFSKEAPAADAWFILFYSVHYITLSRCHAGGLQVTFGVF